LGCVGPLTEANRASSSFSCSSAFSGLLFLRGGKERGLRALVCMVRQHSCVLLMHVHGPRPELAHSSCRALDHVQNNSQHKAGGAGGCSYARVVGWFIRHARTHAGCATVDNLLRRHGPHGVELGRGGGKVETSVCGTARKREKIACSHTCDCRATHKTSTTNCVVRKGLTASASARCCSAGPSPSRAASEAIAPPRLHTAPLIGLLLQ